MQFLNQPVLARQPPRISTGIAGVDQVLGGGLAPNRLYLVEGTPGAGKTTFALQFLFAGRDLGERTLYITLSETAEELQAVAASHGWSLDGIDLFEFAAAETALNPEREMTLLHPWEVELGETLKLITDEVERLNPARVAFDSLSELKLLAQDPLRYRRQILSLKQFFTQRDTTVLMLDDGAASGGDRHLHSLCHGVITLERLTLTFGAARRRLEVQKMRGSAYSEGWHDFTIRRGGLEVFPRLVAAEHHRPFVGGPMPSGLTELDALLDGGPLRGTCTLIAGPAGTGKTTLSLRYVLAAAERGERSVIYEFDERAGTLLARSAKLGMDLGGHVETGLVSIRQIDPAELSPGEFTQMVQVEVEQAGARIVVIDSLEGFLAGMPQEQMLLLQLHELLSYTNQQGVVTFLINPQQGLFGSTQPALKVSYIADALLLTRFFEVGGRIKKALSVIKNRGGGHEDTLRELIIEAGTGVRLGPPLTGAHGVLTGTPSVAGEVGSLPGGMPADAV